MGSSSSSWLTAGGSSITVSPPSGGRSEELPPPPPSLLLSFSALGFSKLLCNKTKMVESNGDVEIHIHVLGRMCHQRTLLCLPKYMNHTILLRTVFEFIFLSFKLLSFFSLQPIVKCRDLIDTCHLLCGCPICLDVKCSWIGEI